MFLRSRLGRLIMWMSLAVAATYFLDPDRGEQRRREMRERIEKMRHAGEQAKLETGV